MSKRTAKRISTAQKRDTAVSLALSGASYSQIGNQLGVSKARAWQLVREELDKLADQTEGNARVLRQRQAERINRLTLGVWQAAINGNQKAIDRVIRLMDREAKLLGLDGPTKYAPTTPEGDAPYDPNRPQTPEERAAAIAELERDLGIERPNEGG